MRRRFYRNSYRGDGFRDSFSGLHGSDFMRVPILGIYLFPSGPFILTIVSGRYYWIPVRFSHPSSNPSGATNRGHVPNKPHQIDPYAVLGISRTATGDEISKAYRNKAKEHHPDKVTNKTPEILALAEQRMKEINEAYNLLKP